MRVMGTAKLLWYFVWRMALLGLASGAVLGAVYGAALLSIGGLYEEFSAAPLPGEVTMGPVQVVVGALLLAGYGGASALSSAPPRDSYWERSAAWSSSPWRWPRTDRHHPTDAGTARRRGCCAP